MWSFQIGLYLLPLAIKSSLKENIGTDRGPQKLVMRAACRARKALLAALVSGSNVMPRKVNER